METKQQQGMTVKNGTAKHPTSKAHQNGEAKNDIVTLPAKETPNSNGNADAEPATPVTGNDPTPEAVKPEPPKTEAVTTEAPKSEVAQAKEEEKVQRIVLNLAGTLKVVEDLHRRSIQRVNLISRIKQLETFEVNLSAEHDELEENPYQGCKLIIEDDKQRRFITTTPGLIRLVSQFIFNACNEKLAEIEAHIVLPTV